MFAIAWQYLTGKAVATDIANRQVPEWPPHPDRVFQALVAAWGNTGVSPGMADALRWLAALSPPQVAADEGIAVPGPRVFVPVNDPKNANAQTWMDNKKRKFSTHIQGIPLGRDRQERFFPATLVHDQTCALIWPDAEPDATQREALAVLCRQVTHVGHSSSLVRMWVEPAPPRATWQPASHVGEGQHLRVSGPGRFEELCQAHVAATAACAARPGAPVPLPPRAGMVRYASVSDPALPRGVFGDQWIVLRRVGGDPLHLPQTLAFTTALRDALNGAADDSVRPVISGHPPGSAAPSDQPHLAVIPLADVGHGHAQGRVLGFALVAPVAADADVHEGLWRALIQCATSEGILRVVAGSHGAVDLEVEDRPVPAWTLTRRRWCGSTNGTTDWATVTPLVLDRLPPKRHQHDDAWVCEQVALSCLRQGLPAPVAVRLLGASAFAGAPSARSMPAFQRKDGSRRWHLHLALTFAVPIAGPLLLGAGRYRGYGLCAPVVPRDDRTNEQETMS